MERCYFAKEGFDGCSCGILTEECVGYKSDCKFYKTKEQYIAQRDKAIDRCREIGKCRGCEYRKKPCRKSDEVQNDD